MDSEKNIGIVDVAFSPDSSKIAILYTTSLHIWDISELRFQILDNVELLTTVNTISWSADSKRIAYVKQKNEQEKEICVYDIHEKQSVLSLPISYSVSTTCLDSHGTRILLLERDTFRGNERSSTIRIIDIASGKEINNISSSVSLNDSEALFKGEEFYVLTDGRVLKIKDKEEVINLDEVISPISSQKFKNEFDLLQFYSPTSDYHELELKNENIIVHGREIDYILSDTLEVREIRQRIHQYYPSNDTVDEKEITEFWTKAEEKYIRYESNHQEDESGQTVYLAGKGQINGFEKVEENDRYIKYNFRPYIFDVPPKDLMYSLVIPPKFMKSYEKISFDNLSGEFREDSSIHPQPYFQGRKVYFRQTGQEVPIKDSSMFKIIDSHNLPWYRRKFKKVINGDKNVYILDEENISMVIHHSQIGGKERLVLSEDGIEIKPLRSGTKTIRSDNPANDYCLDEENVLYRMDPFANYEKIADDSTSPNCSLGEIKWISGSTWPKLYVIDVIGKNTPEAFIQSAPMKNLTVMEDIHLTCPQNLCIFSGKIYWLSNEGEICVSELDGSNIKRRKIINLRRWQSSGKTHDGIFSLIKVEMNDDQESINVKFARLFPESGKIDIFETANLNLRLWNLSIDVKNLFIIVKESRKIYSMTIKKDGLKKGKVLIPSIDKIFSNMLPLGEGGYLISTTEDESDTADLIGPVGPGYCPQLRVMDSNTGLKRRYNVKQSEGQMYGLPGYEINPESRVFSLDDGIFIVSEMSSSNIDRSHRYCVSAWDTSYGNRYPSDAVLIYGRLLEKIDENSVLVSLGSNGIVHSVATYNKKMRKISEKRTVFTWSQESPDSKSKELDVDVLLETFPEVSELLLDDRQRYIETIKDVLPPYDSHFKNGTVVVLLVKINSTNENVPLPHKYVFDRRFNSKELIWMNIQAIICTYSYGRLINPMEITIDIVTRGEPDCKHIPCGALRSLSLCRIRDRYVI